jgi:hypothetical protein
MASYLLRSQTELTAIVAATITIDKDFHSDSAMSFTPRWELAWTFRSLLPTGLSLPGDMAQPPSCWWASDSSGDPGQGHSEEPSLGRSLPVGPSCTIREPPAGWHGQPPQEAGIRGDGLVVVLGGADGTARLSPPNRSRPRLRLLAGHP